MEWEYEYWFAAALYISCKKKCMIRKICGTAKDVYYIEEKKIKAFQFLKEKEVEQLLQARKEWKLQEKYNVLLKENITIIPIFYAQYPEKLRQISSPPYALYVKGRLPETKLPSVAIVGARNCTPYGERMALEFGESLARAGIPIISGMARGIDGAGQRGALNGGGNTYAILGCGVDICYPRDHMGLYTDIQACGGIISEYPPGTSPLATNFPARNRIISGLSDVVLVMEAKERSGSLITADLALEQGKDVYALPGPITSCLSQGCNGLIRQGAGILISPTELMENMGVSIMNEYKNSDKNQKILDTTENMVYSCLGLYPKNISQIIDETDVDTGEVLEVLTRLQIRGIIKEISRQFYIRT